MVRRDVAADGRARRVEGPRCVGGLKSPTAQRRYLQSPTGTILCEWPGRNPTWARSAIPARRLYKSCVLATVVAPRGCGAVAVGCTRHCVAKRCAYAISSSCVPPSAALAQWSPPQLSVVATKLSSKETAGDPNLTAVVNAFLFLRLEARHKPYIVYRKALRREEIEGLRVRRRGQWRRCAVTVANLLCNLCIG